MYVCIEVLCVRVYRGPVCTYVRIEVLCVRVYRGPEELLY